MQLWGFGRVGFPGHCEELPEQRRGNPFPLLQKISVFHRIFGVAGQQSLPCVKGGGVRKDTGGIDATQLVKLCKIRLLPVQKSDGS